MTIEYIYTTSKGEILGGGVAQDVKNIPPMEGAIAVPNISAPLGADVYYSSSQKKVLPLPPRPSFDHVYNYDLRQWELDVTALAAKVRAQRDEMLAASDFTQGADQQAWMTAAQKASWANYRQALRDIPSQPGFPSSVVWPTKP